MIYFISDTHFNHFNFLTFKDEGGERIRKEFESVQEMDETIIERWNDRVKEGDTIYHLGDVFLGKRENLDPIMSRLTGRKRLILGNHDDAKVMSQYFSKIMSWRYFSTDVTGCNLTFMACHYPLHPDTVRGGYKGEGLGFNFCLHGHMHQRLINDPTYINVCVENTGYAPVSMDEIVAMMEKR